MDGLSIRSARAVGYNAYDAWKTADAPELSEAPTLVGSAPRWAAFVKETRRRAKAWRALPAEERERVERERCEAKPW